MSTPAITKKSPSDPALVGTVVDEFGMPVYPALSDEEIQAWIDATDAAAFAWPEDFSPSDDDVADAIDAFWALYNNSGHLLVA